MAYKVKNPTVEAFQWTGQPQEEMPQWAQEKLKAEQIVPSGSALNLHNEDGIPLRVNKGDWAVLKEGRLTPMTNLYFNAHYEEAD